MKFRGTLILALLGMAMLAYVIWVDKPEQKEEDQPKTLFKLDEAKIGRIALTDGTATAAAVRGDRKWMLDQPVKALARKDEWNGMASTLSSLSYERIVDEKGAQSSTFGLDKPSLTVTFTGDQGKVYKVDFGQDAPIGSSVYARIGNDPRVFMVSKYDRDRFKLDLGALRENGLLTGDAYSVESVDLVRPAGTVRLAKSHYNWFQENPLRMRLNDSDVDEFLRKLFEQKVADHLDALPAAEARTKLGAVRYRLILAGEKNEQQTLEIGTPPKSSSDATGIMAWHVNRDDYFLVPATVMELLDTAFDKFRQLDLVEFYPYEVKGLTVEAGGTRHLLSRNKDNEWQWMKDGKPVELDKTKVEQYLETIRQLKAESFIDAPQPASAYGLEPGSVKVILDIENKEGLTLLFGRKENSSVFARNMAYPSVYKLTAAEWEKAKFEPAAWLKTAK